MRSYLVDVRTLFAFAVKRKYVQRKYGSFCGLPKVEENPPGIVTPDQATAILNASIDFAPDALPVVALALFGGLRRSEAEALEWKEISEKFVEVKAHKAKTRQRRLIPISPQLRAWLNTAKEIDGKLPFAELRGQTQTHFGQSQAARGMAAKCASPFFRQLPFRKT